MLEAELEITTTPLAPSLLCHSVLTLNRVAMTEISGGKRLCSGTKTDLRKNTFVKSLILPITYIYTYLRIEKNVRFGISYFL